MKSSEKIAALEEKLKALEKENEQLRGKQPSGKAQPSKTTEKKQGSKASATTQQSTEQDAVKDQPSVNVPEAMQPLFQAAEATVKQYFSDVTLDPSTATIEISNERYVLIRASALSKDFLDSILRLYADREEMDAMAIGKNFLFDIAHTLGLNDAKAFHAKMHVTDPLGKLSAGPVHFAYTGWAFVDISPESRPSPDDDYYLLYNHPFSFEADAWIRAGKRATTPVCIMSTGYSSGWCEESFGIPLTAVEVSCRAKGDAQCTFIMSPPHKIAEHLQQFAATHHGYDFKKSPPAIPTFFQRKQIEEQMEKARQLAEESSRAKSDFVANMSHELRTPLSAILGYTELLKKTRMNTEQSEYLEAICSSGSNLLSTINDIMDLSKLDAGKVSFESVPVRLPDLLDSLERMLASRVKDKQLQYTTKTDKSTGIHVMGDTVRLTQILVNLISNAIKFTEKGSISVQAKTIFEDAAQLTVQFVIKDTGIGIPEDKQAAVFERFTQADSAITRKYGGSGLGLSITRELVELMGGTVNLRSKVHKGTTFTVQLPFLKAATPHYENTAPAALMDGTGLHVLLVEDNVLNQKMTRLMLTNNGFTVSVAGSGTEALNYLKKNRADLVLMDLQIPGKDGYLTSREIRDRLQLHMPIIAITAHAFSGEREKCLAAGMNDYLSKPFREKELLTAISHCRPHAYTDLGFLREQTRNNTKLINEMIRTFIRQTPKDLKTLENALLKQDREQVYKIAHTMRTSVTFFGLQQHIGESLLKLEKSGEDGDNLLEKISQVCRKAMEELQRLIPSA